MNRITLIFFLSLCNEWALNNSWGFEFFWNVPTSQCHKHGMDFMEVAKDYGILQNNNDEFKGDKIVILYDAGMFPALINNPNGPPRLRNGGVPQEGNLGAHLELFTQHLNEQVAQNFSGVGVIDFEIWRPIFRQNWATLEPYKRYSIAIERNRHPFSSERKLEAMAKERFEKHGKVFVEETLKRAIQLRPRAKWSYYAYPYCFNTSPNNPSQIQCPRQVQIENDNMEWLWRMMDTLMPSVYLHSKLTEQQRLNRIVGRIDEAHRILALNKINRNIILYFAPKFQDDTSQFLSKDDLNNSFRTMIDRNVDATILWGSSNDVKSRQKCEEYRNYLHSTLGPAVLFAKLYARERYGKKK